LLYTGNAKRAPIVVRRVSVKEKGQRKESKKKNYVCPEGKKIRSDGKQDSERKKGETSIRGRVTKESLRPRTAALNRGGE